MIHQSHIVSKVISDVHNEQRTRCFDLDTIPTQCVRGVIGPPTKSRTAHPVLVYGSTRKPTSETYHMYLQPPELMSSPPSNVSENVSPTSTSLPAVEDSSKSLSRRSSAKHST